MRRVSCIGGALLALCWVAPLRAQEPTGAVRGRVTDQATLQPLSGATVTIGSRGALTQPNGQYVIGGVRAGPDTVRIRMLGYGPVAQAVTVVAGDTVVVDVTMTAQAIGLSEVVVIGYGEQVAGNITGAVTQVTTEEFNGGRVISPAQLIQNKAPGVQVVDNNEPGGGLTIRIRGATSINASSDPLYVIDGMPIGTGAGGGLSVGRDALNSLNPNDIESITVLRDASAAAIYGANAANGVVLIQTKRGQGGLHIEYSGNVSSSSVDRLPSMLGTAQFDSLVRAIDTVPAHINNLGTANTNWFDEVTQTAIGTEQNVAVSSASDDNNWRLSFGYLNQEGILQNTTAQRLTLGVNYQQRLFDGRLDLRTNVKGSRQYDQFTPGGVLGNATVYAPTQPVVDDTTRTGFYNWPGTALTSSDNPAEILALATDEATTYRSTGNLRADYGLPFAEGLSLNANFGYDVTTAVRESFNPSILHNEQKVNFGTQNRSSPSQLNTVLETYLHYAAPARAVPGVIDVTGGYSYQQEHGDFPTFQAQGLSTDFLGTNAVVTAQRTQNRLFVEDYKLISFFGRATYNLNDRYLAALTLRRDGSSRFGPDNAWATFPSLALAWRISDESFLRGTSWLSDLKLRYSWAKTGNQAFGNYLWASTYQPSNAQATVQWGNEFISTIMPSAVDPNIKWETTRSNNFGFDFGLWSHRLTGSFDYYDKKTEDLIFTVHAAAGTNFSNFVTTNIGSMKNNGIELGLGWRVREARDGGLGWNLDFNVSHNTNELLSINPLGGSAITQQILVGGIAGGVGNTIQVLQPGQPINSFYVYEQLYDSTGRPIQGGYVDQPTRFDSLVNCPGAQCDTITVYRPDGTINSADLRPFHDPAPKWMLGLSSYMTYGRWDLNFTVRAYTGNYVYNNVASNMGNTNAGTGGAFPANFQSSVLDTRFTSAQYFSDYYVEDASFLRLDQLALGYRLSVRGQDMRIFLIGQNLLTITGYSGVDPTAGLNGIDNNIYPRSRTFTSGVSLQF